MRIFRLAMMMSLLCLAPVHAADAPDTGWKLEGTGALQYEVGTEPAGSADRHGAFIRSRSDVAIGARLVQRLPAQAYAGKRVRLSASLKTEGADGGVLVVSVNKEAGTTDTRPTTYLYGTSDWKNYSAVIDVPAEATTVLIGFGLNGRGTLWADNIGIQAVGTDVPVTPRHYPWVHTGGLELSNYDFGVTPQENGKDMLFLKSRSKYAANGFTGLQQCLAARDYIGKRVRFAGRLKTTDASDEIGRGAAIYVRVDGSGKSQSFANMGVYPLRGTNNWRQQSAALDVRDGATNICYGLTLSGGLGEVTLDGAALEIVGNDVPVTAVVDTSGTTTTYRSGGASRFDARSDH